MEFLIADNDNTSYDALHNILTKYGGVTIADNEKEFRSLMFDNGLANSFDIIFLSFEFSVEKSNPINLLKELRESNRVVYNKTKIVMITDSKVVISIMNLYSKNDFLFIKKPFLEEELLDIVGKTTSDNVVSMH